MERKPRTYEPAAYVSDTEAGPKAGDSEFEWRGPLGTHAGDTVLYELHFTEGDAACEGPLVLHTDQWIECYGDHCRDLPEPLTPETVGRDHSKATLQGCSREQMDGLALDDWTAHRCESCAPYGVAPARPV